MDDKLTVELGEGRRVVARYRVFEIQTDQSVDSGGDASAPEPFDLFLASIGTCTGAYIAAFCKQREISTEGIRIVQGWQRDENRRLTKIDVDVELPDSFPDKYRSAVIRAAEQCSIKKTLAAPPEVVVRLAGAS